MAAGPGFSVKNTFVEVEDADAPKVPGLERTRSEPNRQQAREDEDEEEANNELDDASDDDMPVPAIPALYHHLSCDGYESPELWSWVNQGGDPNVLGAVSQWCSVSAGQQICVKNTFLTLDDGPKVPDLQRTRSEPHRRPQEEEPAHDDDEERDHKEAQDVVGAAANLAPPPFGAGDLDVPPPAVPDLNRTTTCDGFDYEPNRMSSWVNQGGDPNALGAAPLGAAPLGVGAAGASAQGGLPAEAYAAAAMPPSPMPGGFPGGGIGVVMVPVPVMVPVQDGVMPSHQMQAVPVDRFTSWPKPAAGPAAAPAAPAPELSRIATPGEPPAGTPSVPAEGERPGDETIVIPCMPDVPRAPVLARAFSVASQVYRIRWTVEARKLRCSDREAVSPPFEISFNRPVQFKMIIRPKFVHEARGGQSFKKAKGKGSVEMRCLEKVEASASPVVTFRVVVGSSTSGGEPPRGPVRHDFSERNTCGLAEGEKEWDFAKHVDQETQTFMVCLEILSGDVAAAAAGSA